MHPSNEIRAAIVDSGLRQCVAFLICATDDESVRGKPGYNIIVASRRVRGAAHKISCSNCYRGEKKQRRAMRRLGRAAGRTVMLPAIAEAKLE